MALEYNRQYIGARYVPQFFKNPDGSWDWAQGFQYEPLTIVRYGENTYTSSQLVPSSIGAPNLNPDYWANTGNYNGTIKEINNELNQLKQEIKNQQNEIDVLEPKTGHKVVISDSYGVKDQTLPRYSWFDSFCPKLRNGFTSYALGGASFVGGNVNTYLDCLKGALANMDAESINKTDEIIIGGGYNDYFTASSKSFDNVSLAMAAFVNFAYKNFPNLKSIFFGWIGNTSRHEIRFSLMQYISLFQRACETVGIVFSDIAFKECHRYDLFLPDKIHPNAIYASNIGLAMYNALKGKATIFTESSKIIQFEYNGKEINIRQTLNSNGVLINGLFDIVKTSSDNMPVTLTNNELFMADVTTDIDYMTYAAVNNSAMPVLIRFTLNNNSNSILLRPASNENWASLKTGFIQFFIPYDLC